MTALITIDCIKGNILKHWCIFFSKFKVVQYFSLPLISFSYTKSHKMLNTSRKKNILSLFVHFVFINNEEFCL